LILCELRRPILGRSYGDNQVARTDVAVARPSREDDTRQAGHIENPPRFQGKLKSLLIGVNHHAVVIRLPGIHFGPQTCPTTTSVLVVGLSTQQTTTPTCPYTAIPVASLNEAVESSRRAGRPVNLGHHRHTEKSHTRRPWAIRSLTQLNPGALHPPLCGELWGFESCFGALAVPDRAAEFLHLW
jgi:hypothetical protein